MKKNRRPAPKKPPKRGGLPPWLASRLIDIGTIVLVKTIAAAILQSSGFT